MEDKKIHEGFLRLETQKTYKIDFDKVKSFDDLKLILESVHLGFNINFIENYDKFDDLKKLLIEVE